MEAVRAAECVELRLSESDAEEARARTLSACAGPARKTPVIEDYRFELSEADG